MLEYQITRKPEYYDIGTPERGNTYSNNVRGNNHSYPRNQNRDFHKNSPKDPDIVSMKEAISALTAKMDSLMEQNNQRQTTQGCCQRSW